MMKKFLGVIVVFITLFSCKQEKGSVVSLHNLTEYEKIKKLQLDDSYINLLNPSLSDKEEYETILKSWSSFHNKVNDVLTKNNFSWGVADSSITVVNKIYFKKDGTINYFLVNIKNEHVSDETKNTYVSLLKNNLDKLTIDLTRDNQFAQCGKVKYKNYE